MPDTQTTDTKNSDGSSSHVESTTRQVESTGDRASEETTTDKTTRDKDGNIVTSHSVKTSTVKTTIWRPGPNPKQTETTTDSTEVDQRSDGTIVKIQVHKTVMTIVSVETKKDEDGTTTIITTTDVTTETMTTTTTTKKDGSSKLDVRHEVPTKTTTQTTETIPAAKKADPKDQGPRMITLQGPSGYGYAVSPIFGPIGKPPQWSTIAPWNNFPRLRRD